MYYVVIALNIRMPYDFRTATSLIFSTIGSKIEHCLYVFNKFIYYHRTAYNAARVLPLHIFTCKNIEY